jgi:uncharacterized protein (UPF0276 family)
MGTGAVRSGVAADSIPARAGIGLRAPHYRELIERKPDIGWVEVHSENYFGAGGQPHWYLERVRRDYPLSLHGVGLALGSAGPLDREHLTRLRALVERYEPDLISEHLAWSSVVGRHFNDLLPLPYTEEALQVFSAHVMETQDFLERRILIENPSTYVSFRHSTIPEWEFLRAVAERTGCGILLDINNVYVSAVNHGFDPLEYIASIPFRDVGEIHLAGFEQGEHCLTDTHGTRVADPVWALYESTVQRSGPIPTLIEWDTNIPALAVLLAEARTADAIQEVRDAVAA